MLQLSPQTTNLTELQRKPRNVIQKTHKQKSPVFITDRSRVSAVIMDVDYYDNLVKLAKGQEDSFWLQAATKSFDFWDHASNDAYEKLL